MHPVSIEQIDANSETATLVEWRWPEGAPVAAGAVLGVVETSKMVAEFIAPAAGLLVIGTPAGQTFLFNTPIGYITDTPAEAAEAHLRLQPEAAEAHLRLQPDAAGEKPAAAPAAATKKARQLAAQYGIALETLNKTGLITEKDVHAAIAQRAGAPAHQPRIITHAGQLPENLPRVLVLGAGLGAMQVIDILLNQPHNQVVGCLDDDAETHRQVIFGAPVLGGLQLLETLWLERRFDQAIISVSSNIALRQKWFQDCQALHIPFANAIDPSVRINRSVVIGQGNVICSHVHLGVATVLGDNNFISANTSIDHHNVWGSHITTGPNCATSSRVRVGDAVVFGTGVFMQPGISIGSGCRIASGAILTQSVPEAHAVKTQIHLKIAPLPKAQP